MTITEYRPYPKQDIETNPTTNVGHISHEIMEPRLSGDADITYVEKTVEGAGHRCDECGLVWAKAWYANTCGSRDHATRFNQAYAYKPEGYRTHGKVAWNVYTRYALGRDKAWMASQEPQEAQEPEEAADPVEVTTGGRIVCHNAVTDDPWTEAEEGEFQTDRMYPPTLDNIVDHGRAMRRYARRRRVTGLQADQAWPEDLEPEFTGDPDEAYKTELENRAMDEAAQAEQERREALLAYFS
jgi:hypothetical protein